MKTHRLLLAPDAVLEAPPAAAPAAPAVPPPPGTSKHMAASFDALEKFITKAPEEAPANPPAQPAKPTKAAEAPKPAEGKPDAPAKPTEATPEAAKAPEKSEAGQKLRTAYESTKKERDALKQELDALKARKLEEHPDYKPFSEKLTAAEKRAQELDEKLKFTDYSKSEEFQTKYVKPLQETWADAQQEILQFPVTDPTTQELRLPTEDEFSRIMSAPTVEAVKMARDLFGDFAPQVIQRRNELVKLAAAQRKALDEYKTLGAEREKASSQAREEQTRREGEMFQRFTKEAMENPALAEWFKAADGDTEGAQLFKDSLELATAAMSGQHLAKLTPEERVRLHAEVRNAAAAAPLLHHKLVKAGARIKELEAKLAEFKKSEPGSGAAAESGKPPGPKRGTMDAALNDLNKFAKEVTFY